jgi:hypothetical protein
MATVFSTFYVKYGFPVDYLVTSAALMGGNLVGISSTGTVILAQANAVATAACAFCLQDYPSGGAAGALYTKGVVKNAGVGLTPGLRVYLSATTAGAITQVQPSTAGNIVQPVGIALNTTDVLFDINIGGVVTQIQAAGTTTIATV